MKKISVVFIFCILLTGNSLWAKTLDIVTEDAWPPYSYKDEGVVKGYATEVLSGVFKSIGTDYTVKSYPWARAEKMALSGEADAVFNASHKEKREAACYYPSEQLFDSTYVFFIKKTDMNRLKYNSFEDLKGHKVGTTKAYSYTKELLDYLGANTTVSESDSDLNNLRRLAAGKIDYFPGEIANITMLLRQEGLSDEIVPLPKPLIQKPYYIIFNKKNVDQDFVEKFSDALKTFKGTPEFKEISSRYFGG